MVDRVEMFVAVRPCGPAVGRRHQPQGGAHACQSVLLGSVVEGVPAQVLGVAPVGVAAGHRDEHGADLAPSRGEHSVDVV